MAHILVDKWARLPRLANLVKKDAGFRRFVLDHVDATLDPKDVQRIRAKVKDACPLNLWRLCADFTKQTGE